MSTIFPGFAEKISAGPGEGRDRPAAVPAERGVQSCRWSMGV